MHIAVAETLVHNARAKGVARWIDAGGQGHVQPAELGVGGFDQGCLGLRDQDTAPKAISESRRAAAVICVGMGKHDGAYPIGGDAVGGNVAQQRLDVHAGTGVDQGCFVAAIHQVDVAIVEVGDADAGPTAAHKVDISKELHSCSHGQTADPDGAQGSGDSAF